MSAMLYSLFCDCDNDMLALLLTRFKAQRERNRAQRTVTQAMLYAAAVESIGEILALQRERRNAAAPEAQSK